MLSSQFVRDAKRVYAALQETNDNALTCIKPVKVYIPARFPQRDLAVFENEITIVGIMAVVVEDKYYATSMVCAMIRTEPNLVNTVVIDDTEYLELVYEPGDRVISNLNLVKIDNLMYRIYDELFAKGRVPWYITYNDLGKIFETSQYHAGVQIGSTPAVMEMITATISRSPDNLRRYYRQVVQTPEDIVVNPPVVIPLRNVSYGATNVVAKLIGPYFDEGMTSALVDPGERVERGERLLRT